MKRNKVLSAACAAALCMGAVPVQAAAASPEFAYTEEKWASLEDNVLEYGEIADLIHEYNTTVQQNLLDYNDYKGKSSLDISKEYYNSAEDMLERIEYPEDDDASYASRLSSALSSEIQAENLVEQGDNNVDDGEIVKLGYDMEEAELVKQAEQLMISYWSQTESLAVLEDAVTQAENSYEAAVTKKAAGMAAQAEVDSMAEAVTTAKASLLTAKGSLEKTKEQLCLMLGWPYGAEVDIKEVPQPDLEKIGAIDVEADIETALENNYSLKMTAKRIENARSASVRETQERTYKSQKETASTSVKNAYNSLLSEKSGYEQALESYELAKTELSASAARLQAGTITAKDYASKESALLSAEVSLKTQELSLLTALNEYEWAVNGLASVS